jgi:hypothetical protein
MSRAVLVVWVWIGVVLCAAPMAMGSDPAEISERSSRLFQEAVETIDTDRGEALAKLEESIDLLETLIDDHGLDNASVHFNLGNAYALAERYGRAIEHYRLALRADPTDTEVADNLEYVRSRVPDRLGPMESASGTRKVIDAVPPWVRIGLALVFFSGLWVFLGVRTALAERDRRSGDPAQLDEGSARRLPLWPVWVFAGLSVVSSSVVAFDVVWPGAAAGVVVDAPAVARQGPSEAAYDPAFTRPVSPGVEFRVLEIRDGIDAPGQWVLAEFADARRAWFRRGSVALVGSG